MITAESGSVKHQSAIGFNLRNIWRKIDRRLFRPKLIHQDRLIVVDEDSDRCVNPVFLTGVHRSGTTLLRHIIDSHSHIACPPESFFLTGFADILKTPRFFDGFSGMGFDRAGVIRGLSRGISHFFETYRRSKGKPRWADKTPEYVQLLPFLEEVFGPTCQYLMIYRHPFDVINSLLESGWDFSKEHWNFLNYHDDHFKNLVLYHTDILQQQIDFAATHDDRCHSVHYEKLLADPEKVLKGMFEFLDEPWEEEVLFYHTKPHDWGTGDPKAKTSKGFRPSIGNWKRWPREQIEYAAEKLQPQLDQLGYSVEQNEPVA